MSFAFRVVVTCVFALAVFIGVLEARNQPPPRVSAGVVSTPTPVPAPVANAVMITGGGASVNYQPPVLTVHQGAAVTWTNHSPNDETVTADNGAFDSGVLTPGQSYHWTAAKTGRFSYGSYLQPGTSGVIVVQP